MATASYEIPQVKLNGKEIPIKDMSCTKLEIIKQVDRPDVVKMEMIGIVDKIEPVADADYMIITVVDYTGKRKATFKAFEIC